MTVSGDVFSETSLFRKLRSSIILDTNSWKFVDYVSKPDSTYAGCRLREVEFTQTAFLILTLSISFVGFKAKHPLENVGFGSALFKPRETIDWTKSHRREWEGNRTVRAMLFLRGRRRGVERRSWFWIKSDAVALVFVVSGVAECICCSRRQEHRARYWRSIPVCDIGMLHCTSSHPPLDGASLRSNGRREDSRS